jgi:hypothetical protein
MPRRPAACRMLDQAKTLVTTSPRNDTLPGGPEERLTAEFARYLFDQGLCPLTKPMTGGLQPDLLDLQARFYVEAKQYKNSAHSYIVKAGAQILDTVGKLRGDPRYEVEEALCVIFRLKAPFHDLPPTLHTEALRMHLVLMSGCRLSTIAVTRATAETRLASGAERSRTRPCRGSRQRLLSDKTSSRLLAARFRQQEQVPLAPGEREAAALPAVQKTGVSAG